MRKIIFISSVVFIIFSLFCTFYYINYTKKITKNIYLDNAKELKDLFKDLVNKTEGKTAALTYILSKDKKIIDALIKKDNSLIDYKEIIKGIEHYASYNNLWLQIIDKDGYSFYRSWTNKVGDHAASARVDVSMMIKNPKPMQQVSTGRFDMTFKTMLPLFNEKEFIGIIELISHFNSISRDLKSKDIEPIMVVDKSYTKRFIKPFTGLFIGDNYVANLDASRGLMKKIEIAGIEKFLNIKNYLLYEDYLVTTDQIRCIKNNPMGYFILFNKIKNIDMSTLQEFKVRFFQWILLLSILFILAILLYINRRYVRILNIEVNKKTKKIRQQKSNLKALLNIYDKNVIFSKTDLRGYITHVSDAFCKISGYSKNELIGQNHNIIRHPDMSKKAFKFLWDELKKESTVKLEVKNLKKDGGYYWVNAEFEPDYNKKGKLIGFSAVREDITAKKDVEEIQKEIIFTMGSIGESRSKETGEHVKRVAEYSKLLALYYGLSNEEAEMIKQASPMHDIGKVAIPDAILNKRSKLTKTETIIMQTHALKGYDMLKSSNRPLLKTASIIALEHHEKWDGTGYPTGLKGKNIHIYGRITAVADVFDALGSDRCYKSAWNDEDIFRYFNEQKGKHFDPELVDIFFAYLDEFLAIRDKYKDKR